MIKIIKEKLKNKPSTFMFLQIFAYEIHLAKIRIKNKIFPSKKLKINKYKNLKNLKRKKKRPWHSTALASF